MRNSASSGSVLVSVCIPVRNETKCLRDTLQSLREQSVEDFEVLIFDNASNDDTADICRHFCRLDPRFHFYPSVFNVGQVHNFNRCIAAATGQFVAIRSGNDLVEPDYLAKTVDLMANDPDVGVAYARSRRITEQGEDVERGYPIESFFDTDIVDPAASASKVMRCFIHPAAYFGVYRKTLLDRLQPLRHVYGSDKIFVCEAALYAAIRCVPEYLCHERKHRRQAALASIFSEDAVFGLAEESVYGKFECMTPFADMIWGFTDMFSRSSLKHELRGRLCQEALVLFSDHYRQQLSREKQRLLSTFEQNTSHFLGEDQHAVATRSRANYLTRITRLQFIYSGDAELRDVAKAISMHL